MKLNARFQALFLIFVVLGIYLPAAFGGYNSVDDREMVNSILNQPFSGDWISLFHPSQKFYYRPLLMMTYYLDAMLWGSLPFFMHLENIFLHVANTLLVFCLARQVMASVDDSRSALPLLSALLFGLHPIATESVCWISGLTDLLGTFFVLLSFLSLVQGLKKGSVWFGVPAALFLMIGIMSKEVMLFFLPLAVFLVLRWPVADIALQRGKRWVLSGIFVLPFLLSAGFYGLARFASYGTGDQGILHVLNNYAYTPFHTLRVCFKVLGFYVKKLFLPLPLNFAIVQVNDQYVWLGMLALAFVLFALFRRRLGTDLLVVSFSLVLPAVVIALTRVAWTPLAERYLYLPAVFSSIGIILLLHESSKRFNLQKLLVAVLAILLLPLGWVTTSRAVIWQDNLLLYEDTIRKSPTFLPLYNEYAVALAENGRMSEAEQYLEKGRQMDSRGDVLAVHTNQASLLANEGDIGGALKVIDDFMAVNDGKMSVHQMKGVVKAVEQIKLKAITAEHVNVLNNLLEDVYGQLYLATKDPFVRYRQAQLAMLTGQRDLAGDYFEQTYASAPDSAHYKQAAKILAEKMKTERE
jgi:tetratricopeptide (TPR) repeat protein